MQQQQPAMAQQQQVQNNTQSSASSAFDLMDIKAVNINWVRNHSKVANLPIRARYVISDRKSVV